MVYAVVLHFMWCLASGYTQLEKDISGICEYIATCEVIGEHVWLLAEIDA